MTDVMELFDRLVVQELQLLKRRTGFCSPGFQEVLNDLDLPLVSPYTDEVLVVTGELSGYDRQTWLHKLAEGPSTLHQVTLTSATLVSPQEPVTLADVAVKSPEMTARKAQIRAYALRRVTEDNVGDVSIDQINYFLEALGIKSLILKEFTFEVPVAGVVTYTVRAESVQAARHRADEMIKKDIEQDYLEDGDGPSEVLPSADVRPKLVDTRDH